MRKRFEVVFKYTISIYIFHFYIMYHKCDSKLCVYIIYFYIIYHFYILYIIIIDIKTSWLPMARRTGPYRPVPLLARSAPTFPRSCSGTRGAG